MELDLSNNVIGVEGAVALAETNNESLQEIKLKWNMIGTEGTVSVLNWVKEDSEYKRWKCVDLRYNGFDEEELDESTDWDELAGLAEDSDGKILLGSG